MCLLCCANVQMNMGDAMTRAEVFHVDLQRKLYPHMRHMVPLPSVYVPDFIAANQAGRANNILTGSKNDGTAYFPWQKGDHTCSNWTSNGEGAATVGHHDRHGGGNVSWNAAHDSRGCSAAALVSTGGAGFLYCFAAD